MDHTQQDLLAFFSQQPQALPLCEAFLQKLQAQHPETHTRVQKTQITFSNRHVFACLSLARVRKKTLLPDPYLVLTLGLPAPLAAPGRDQNRTLPRPLDPSHPAVHPG